MLSRMVNRDSSSHGLQYQLPRLLIVRDIPRSPVNLNQTAATRAPNLGLVRLDLPATRAFDFVYAEFSHICLPMSLIPWYISSKALSMLDTVQRRWNTESSQRGRRTGWLGLVPVSRCLPVQLSVQPNTPP